MGLWYDWENLSLEEVSSTIINNIGTYLKDMNDILQEAVDILDFVVEGTDNEADEEACRYVLQRFRSIVEGRGGVVIPDYKRKGDDSHGNNE